MMPAATVEAIEHAIAGHSQGYEQDLLAEVKRARANEATLLECLRACKCDNCQLFARVARRGEP